LRVDQNNGENQNTKVNDTDEYGVEGIVEGVIGRI